MPFVMDRYLYPVSAVLTAVATKLIEFMAKIQRHGARPRRKQPEHRFAPAHQRAEWQVRFQFVEKHARHQRHARGFCRLRPARPRDRQRVREVERLAQREPPQVAPRARRIDHPVQIPLRIAHHIRRILREAQPEVLARHKLEALARRLQKTRRLPPPQQHRLAVQLRRPQLPLRLAHRLLPSVEIARHIHRVARQIDFGTVPGRERKHHLAGRIHEIAVTARRHQPGVRRQPGRRGTLVAERKPRRRLRFPVAVELDHAGRR
jgi:hypothetical protein